MSLADAEAKTGLEELTVCSVTGVGFPGAGHTIAARLAFTGTYRVCEGVGNHASDCNKPPEICKKLPGEGSQRFGV